MQNRFLKLILSIFLVYDLSSCKEASIIDACRNESYYFDYKNNDVYVISDNGPVFSIYHKSCGSSATRIRFRDAKTEKLVLDVLNHEIRKNNKTNWHFLKLKVNFVFGIDDNYVYIDKINNLEVLENAPDWLDQYKKENYERKEITVSHT